ANRLIDRNISLSDEQRQRLTDATAKAGEKGIKESLVLMDSLAFVVNVPNNTVITALDKSETDLNVFTNIDGAVII
ncbi:MAG: flagellar protein, partial [Lachnospiraceae bacterium]|nr:flagellar protein [Lachnospiraceae bacterium]